MVTGDGESVPVSRRKREVDESTTTTDAAVQNLVSS